MDINQYITDRVGEGDGGCLEWKLKIHNRGYGVAKVKGESVWAHRLSYELHKGRIPEGLTIDHLCFNKACVNPEHLEAVTLEENYRRYMAKFYKDNPTFPCGHSRTGPTAELVTAGKYKNGTVKKALRCKPCSKEYAKQYMKTYKLKRNPKAPS